MGQGGNDIWTYKQGIKDLDRRGWGGDNTEARKVVWNGVWGGWLGLAVLSWASIEESKA